MQRTRSLIMLVTLVVAGCSGDRVAVGTAVTEGPELSPNEVTASERWMTLTRGILGRREIGGPNATARTFALVAVAQYNAAVAAGTSGATRAPSEAAAVSAASAAVLASLYPVEQDTIAAQLNADRTYFAAFAAEKVADYGAGETIGASVSEAVLARAATDRTKAVWTGSIPTGPGYWTNTAPAQPVLPLWGASLPWALTSGSQFRPAAPPAFNSTEFLAALAEVKSVTAARTPEQLTIAQFWQGASGPGGPMGYFSAVAGDLASRDHLNERRTARVFAVLHMAMMDATIACWDAKYTYWYVRPFQADASITTPVGRPNFPSYPSAHSCVSSSAAAVLSGLFPAAKTMLAAKVDEAGNARIYAGLHFRFDVTAGQTLGGQVGALVLINSPKANIPISLR
jgi:membrane-associated phospholipid phosphatase